MRNPTYKKISVTPIEARDQIDTFNDDHRGHRLSVSEYSSDHMRLGVKVGRRVTAYEIACMDCADAVFFDVTYGKQELEGVFGCENSHP